MIPLQLSVLTVGDTICCKQVEAEEEPLKVGQVDIPEAASQMIHTCWQITSSATQYKKLYDSAEGFFQLIEQVIAQG
jgi:hypothetical protein